MFKYSYDSLAYYGEPVDRSIARLARFELLPASGDPFGALEKGEGKEFFDQIHRTGEPDHSETGKAAFLKRGI